MRFSSSVNNRRERERRVPKEAKNPRNKKGKGRIKKLSIFKKEDRGVKGDTVEQEGGF